LVFGLFRFSRCARHSSHVRVAAPATRTPAAMSTMPSTSTARCDASSAATRLCRASGSARTVSEREPRASDELGCNATGWGAPARKLTCSSPLQAEPQKGKLGPARPGSFQACIVRWLVLRRRHARARVSRGLVLKLQPEKQARGRRDRTRDYSAERIQRVVFLNKSRTRNFQCVFSDVRSSYCMLRCKAASVRNF
jgi:hypothetical protein